ncbi:MAG: hypothetical protein M1824_002772 [Vezdaea acicularis]|nr:MAG: hypothetical protein M1824_002772 [Vezdaea acicularis]
MTTILAQVILAWIKGRGVDLQDAFVGVLEVQGIEVVRGRLVPQAIIGEQEKGLEGELADGHQRGTSIEEMIVRDLHIEGGIALGLLTRGREPSPADDRAMRSPPPAKRERVRSPIRDDRRRSPPAGPRGSYRPRSRSPPRRDDRFVAQDPRGWGGRSPSPPPRGTHADDRLEPISGQVSAATSRRSSPPPVHSSRLAQQENEVAPLDRAPQTWGARRPRSPLPPQASTRSPYRAHSPPPEKRGFIDREPSPGRRGYSPRARSPPRGPSNNRSPIPRRDEEYNRNGSYDDRDSGAAQWGGSGRGSHNGYGRGGPPNGPSRHYSGSAGMSPPAGPASAPVSMSAHNRQGNVSVLSAPRQPRGDPGRGSVGRESSYPGPPSGGYRRGPPPIHTRGPHHGGSAGSTPTSATSGGPPTGPRGGFAPPFRSNNSTSTTYPRTQRFNNHTAGMPQIVAGGKLLPAYEISDKLAKLEADKKRLEEALAEKEAKKRAAIREWDRLERESAREGYKTELADKHVKALAGEGGMDGDAF